MKKLKTALQSKWLYVILTIILIGVIIGKTKITKYKSNYVDGNVSISGEVLDYSLNKDKISLSIKAKEKIIGNYYYKNKDEINNIKIGSLITISGQVNTPNKNSIPNTFNYQNYLYNNQIYKTISIKNIESVINDQTIFEKIKNWVYEKCQENAYLKLFIIGDKSSLDANIYNNFKDIGVAHLLAVSGMHVSMFVSILSIFLKRVRDTKRTIIITLILLLYAYIVDFSPSILRVVMFYILNKINKYINLNLDNKQLLFFTAFFILLINPFYLYQIGFIYSFVTVYAIIITQKYYTKSYIKNIFIISFWALLFTMPITVNINYEINLITFFSNFILIPYVTFILYPISLLCFVFSELIPLLNLLSSIMEFVVFLISKIDLFVIVIPKINYIFLIIYYFILYLVIYYNSKFYSILIIVIFLNSMTYRLNSFPKIIFLDVGQGDSCLIINTYHNNVTVIDTGGIISYGTSSKYLVSDNVIIYLKSIGITKLSNLIITHGDYDHMGEAINLVENFKVEKVIFNCGEFNELEQDLIKVLDKKKIPYYSCIKELNIDDNKLYFLNNKDYGNENDNSSVIYTELNKHKFLFMGDAGVEVEQDLIEKYNLKDIDILKVGHHGSKTSSCKSFINKIEPKYSIISVGKNNRYGHPNKEVLDNLDNSKIYRTDEDGSIIFKIKNDKLKIETCSP